MASGFYPSPNLESKSGATSPSFGLRFPQFLTPVFPSMMGFFPFYRENFVKGVDCSVKIVESKK